jgi:hypothetical protein
MKWKIIAAFFLIGIWGFFVADQAEATVKVTVKNNRSHNLSIAFCWAGFDLPDDTSKGWYNIKAGESKTITIREAVYALTAQGFGYYATGTTKDGKTIVWSGKSSDDRRKEYWIHPKKSFTGQSVSNGEPISGGKKVDFRALKLKKTGSTNEDATATITFNE